jgi:hypothetical protein
MVDCPACIYAEELKRRIAVQNQEIITASIDRLKESLKGSKELRDDCMSKKGIKTNSTGRE